MVPIVSKKSASMREKTRRMMETTPSLPKPPKRSTLPSVLKIGTAIGEPVSSGTVLPQPVGFVSEMSLMPAKNWTMTAITVEATIEISTAPLTPRT